MAIFRIVVYFGIQIYAFSFRNTKTSFPYHLQRKLRYANIETPMVELKNRRFLRFPSAESPDHSGFLGGVPGGRGGPPTLSSVSSRPA